MESCLSAKKDRDIKIDDQAIAICLSECGLSKNEINYWKKELKLELCEKKGEMKPKLELIQFAEIETDPDLKFMGQKQIARIKEFAKSGSGKLYKFDTLGLGVTDPFNRGHGRREFSEEEKKLAARSLFARILTVNHNKFPPFWELDGKNLVLDSEYVNGSIVGVVYIEDEKLNDFYAKGLVTGPSVEFFPRDETCSGTGASKSCEEEGVRFIGLTIGTRPWEIGDPTATLKLVEMLGLDLTSNGQKPLGESGSNRMTKKEISEEEYTALTNIKAEHDKVKTEFEAVKKELETAKKTLQEKEEAKKKLEAEHGDECPSGQIMHDGKCVPMSEFISSIVKKEISDMNTDINKKFETLGKILENAKGTVTGNENPDTDPLKNPRIEMLKQYYKGDVE